MAVHKNKKTGNWEVQVYDPRVKKKVYVGTRPTKRGPGGADELFREKTNEFSGQTVPHTEDLTLQEYAKEWLELHHGQGTRRPAESTRDGNECNIRKFLEDFGDRPIRDGITRREALAWIKRHPNAHA